MCTVPPTTHTTRYEHPQSTLQSLGHSSAVSAWGDLLSRQTWSSIWPVTTTLTYGSTESISGGRLYPEEVYILCVTRSRILFCISSVWSCCSVRREMPSWSCRLNGWAIRRSHRLLICKHRVITHVSREMPSWSCRLNGWAIRRSHRLLI